MASTHLRAVSLAETLIVVGLVGLLLLPVLLTSTTYFSGQMLKTRQRLALAHNVSLLLNQMINHFGATNQLITSTSQETFTSADELHYTFYDPVKATQIYGGFKLTTLGNGRRKLESLTYSSGTWSAISPYRTSVATAYTVPGAAVFDYCNPDACGKTPDQATFVRLSGWTFRDESAPSRTMTLPTTDIYLNSRRATEGRLTSQKARLLYSTTPTQAFGATGNLELLALSPSRKTLWMVPQTLSAAGGVTAGLMTIASSLDTPGNASMMVDETRGNVFFAGTNSDLYQWNSLMTTAQLRATGLGGQSLTYSSIVSPYSGRVYFGCANDVSCTLRYYDPATNTLSTITGSKMNMGAAALVADPTRKVIYAGWNNSTSKNDSGIVMFNEDVGTLTTLLTMTSGTNNSIAETLSLNPVTGRLYFAFRKSTGPLWAWTPQQSGVNYTTGSLQSIGNALVTLGKAQSIQALPKATNDVVFADNNGIYLWKDGDVSVTTLRTSVNSTPMQRSMFAPCQLQNLVFNGTYDANRDSFYWYQGGSNSGVYGYDIGSATLRTLSPVVGQTYGKDSLWLDSNTGYLYIGNSNTTNPYNNVLRWNSTTNTLTTVITNTGTPGWGNALFTTPDSSYLFVGNNTAAKGRIYNLGSSTLSTMTAGGDAPASFSSLYDSVTGRVFFSGQTSASHDTYYSWHPSTGLTTLVSGSTKEPGYWVSAAVDRVRKYVVFGSATQTAAPVYVWSYGTTDGSTSSTLYKATQQGQPAGRLSLNFTSGGYYTHKAAAVDGNRNLYLVNKATNSIDRYLYNSSASQYALSGTMTSSSTVINSVTSMAIDQSNAGFSILNGNTKTVYNFSDRSVTGAVSPASNFTVSENTTPTSLAIDRRNGDFYVVDSTVTSSAIKVRRYTSAGTYKGTAYDLTIDVSAASLGTSAATGEANFKIQLDELRNVLYLAAPTLNRLYVLSIPEPAA